MTLGGHFMSNLDNNLSMKFRYWVGLWIFFHAIDFFGLSSFRFIELAAFKLLNVLYQLRTLVYPY